MSSQNDLLPIINGILSNKKLWQIGWFRSFVEQKVVDGEGNPLPWINYPAIELLQERVSHGLNIFEYGSGFGTLWWAARAHKVICVEHDRNWYTQISPILPNNARCIYQTLERGGDYCTTIKKLTFQKFHIVIIDGRDRVNCALHCVESLTDDGVIIFDDTDRTEYIQGRNYLKEQGFKELRLMGIKPLTIAEYTGTSFFYRENNCLEL